MGRLIKYVMLDIFRNKIVMAYAMVLAVMAWSVFSLEDNSSKGLLSLLNVILLIVPLVSVIFSTIYLYNSAEFIELLLSQPIRRSRIWISLFTGLCLSMSVAFIAGAGIPLILYEPGPTGWMMLLTGILLSCVFISFAFMSAILASDKAKGIGIAILLWLFFALIFDGLVLFLLFQFGDYPIEKPMIVLTAFSPVDLARILILLHLDVSAMMGYSGALFREFFGTTGGLTVSFFILLFWVFAPFLFSLYRFTKKDL